MAEHDPGDRWLTREGGALAMAVVDALRRGRSLSGLGLGEVGGRVDLRGLRLEPPVRLVKARLHNLDLSGASLPSVLLDRCDVRDCVLDAAGVPRIAIFGGSVSDTSFTRADLRNAGPLGAWTRWRGTTFTRCSFAHANLKGTTTGVVDFVECDFSHAKLDKVEFNQAGFVGCTFAGRLRDVIFRARGYDRKRRGDNPFSRNDLGDVTLEFTSFRGLDLSDCVLPRAAGHLVLRRWHCAMERAHQTTAHDPSLPARLVHGISEHVLRSSTPAVRVNVVAEADFAEGRELAVELLRRFDAECGG